MRSAARAVAAVAVAAATASCAGIPTGGLVHEGRVVRAVGAQSDPDVRVLPVPAQPNLRPLDVVHGFLRALVNADGDYEIARTYLTSRGSAAWRTGVGVTTYDDGTTSVRQTDVGPATRTIELDVDRRGFIDSRGRYSPAGGRISSSFQLVRQHGEWRIDRLPRGVLLSTSDAQRAFRLRTLYFLDRSQTTVVPEQVLLRPQPRGLATALVRALIAGPGPWIAPAVRSAFPKGTALVGNVPVTSDGIAVVNLTGRVRLAAVAQLRALSAQLVWTLAQVPEVSSVRVLADGATLTLPGVPPEQHRFTWSEFNPAPTVDLPPFFDAADGWRSVGGGSTPALRTASGLSSLAMSADGRILAALRAGRRSASLLVWRNGGLPAVRLTADALTPPTTDQAGNVLTVALRGNRRWVAEVTPTGELREVPASAALTGEPVQDLRVSRDGARVAAVVGAAGRGRLVVARVEVTSGGVSLTRTTFMVGVG